MLFSTFPSIVSNSSATAVAGRRLMWRRPDASGGGGHRPVSHAPPSPSVPHPAASALSLEQSGAELLSAAGDGVLGDGVLAACFCNARGLDATLNWATHARRAGMRPVVGIDGPPPTSATLLESAAWAAAKPRFVLLPSFAEALNGSRVFARAAPPFSRGWQSGAVTGKVARAAADLQPGAAASSERRRSKKGYQFWLVRWYGALQLMRLAPAATLLLSDSDVVWHRDPLPYLLDVSARHPRLDVLIHSDHSVYAEDCRQDVPYSAAVQPDRRALLGSLQIVGAAAARNGSRLDYRLGAAPADFDLDPQPAFGAKIGTWNPGILVARPTEGAHGLLRAWLLDFEGQGRRQRGESQHALAARRSTLSSQSHMNKFLARVLSACGRSPDAPPCKHPADRLLYHVRGEGGLRAGLGLLPPLQFGSLAAIAIVREAALFSVNPYATHATQVVGAGVVFVKNNKGHMGECLDRWWCTGRQVTAATVKAFTQRHFGQWAVPDPPAYYEGGFLSYTPRARASPFEAHSGSDGEQWARHLADLQEQLQELQSALALAITLNRSLVLPRVLASCVYAMWPFATSADNPNCQPMHMQGLYPRRYEALPSYYLNVPRLLRARLPLREASFLSSDGAAPLRHSRLSLVLCDEPAAGNTAAQPGGQPGVQRAYCTTRGVPLLRTSPRASEAAAALAPLRHVRLLHLESVRDAFGSFDSVREAAAFAARVGPVLGEWCCQGQRPDSGFVLGFKPRLGGASSRPESRAPSWTVAPRMNNIFGRAELRKSTPCCQFLGLQPSLAACQRAAERMPPPHRVTAVTFHLPSAQQRRPGSWDGTCYGVVDGTWLPVRNGEGQVLADSARREVRIGGPSAGLAYASVNDLAADAAPALAS